MTEAALRKLVVDTAIKYLGCKESDGSHKKIIDIYNSQSPIPVGYKVTYYDAWCAAFVSAVAVELGLTDIILPECGCGRMITLYKNKGRWEEADSYVPDVADIIMYDWDDSGSGDNTGGADHVGFVVSVSGSTIKVIEGNKSDSVAYRSVPVDGLYIRGFCLPDYASKAPKYSGGTTTTTATTSTDTISGNVDTVKEVQIWLNRNYASGLYPDGLYGSLTKKALIKALQKTLGVTADGVYGPVTNAAVKVLKKGSTGDLVKILQAFLVCNGYKTAYVDGDFGSGTETALKSYQSKVGITADGEAGQQTFTKLCT